MPLLTRLACTLAAVVCCASVLVTAQTNEKDAKPANASVAGRVTVGDKPARGVFVALLPYNSPYPSREGQTAKAKTDADGRYHIAGVAAGRYRLAPLASAYVLAGANEYELTGKAVTVEAGERVENLDLKLVPGGVITGRVTDAEGRPVIEAYLTVEPADERRGGMAGYRFRPWQTDDRGVYRIFGLPAGTYKVSASLPSRDPLSKRTYHPDAAEAEQAKPVEVTPGGEAKEIDIKIGQPSQGYEIAGRVTDEGGQPVPRVTLDYRFTPFDGDRRRWTGSSVGADSRGEFRLSGLKPGVYTLLARDDYSRNSAWYGEPLRVELHSGDATGVEVKVRRGGTVSGVVVVEGAPDAALAARLSRHRIASFVRPADPQEQMMMSRPSFSAIEAGGAFRLGGVAPGRVQISLASGERAEGVKLLRVERDGRDVTQGFDVGPGEEVTGVRVVCAYGTGIIKGQVQLQGGALPEGGGLFVSCRLLGGAEGRPLGGTTADARGRFVIDHLPPGEYEVTVGYRPAPGSPPPGFRPPRAVERVSVTNGAETPVVLVINLGQGN
jgi:protocatechuate 3,4-dioxygenase beta subunit